MTISGADERIHPVEDPSEHWSDSLYFNAWDAASGTFLLARIALLPNRPGASAGLIAWSGGRPAYFYGHNLDEVPLADWDDLRIAGLRFEELEPLRSWELNLEDGDNRASLRWDGFSGVVDYADNRQPLPRPVAWGHYEQSCRVTGNLELAGRAVKVDGVGHRDHSWGFRDWGGIREWHWVTGFLGGAQRSFNLFHVTQADGTVTVNGFVHDGGEDLLLVEVERTTTETAERGPEGFELAMTVEGGRRFVVRGAAHGMEVPVRPGGDHTVVHEQPMRLESDDGLEGYGIYELLENSRAPGSASVG
jgi:hypothetical protein